MKNLKKQKFLNTLLKCYLIKRSLSSKTKLFVFDDKDDNNDEQINIETLETKENQKKILTKKTIEKLVNRLLSEDNLFPLYNDLLDRRIALEDFRQILFDDRLENLYGQLKFNKHAFKKKCEEFKLQIEKYNLQIQQLRDVFINLDKNVSATSADKKDLAGLIEKLEMEKAEMEKELQDFIYKETAKEILRKAKETADTNLKKIRYMQIYSAYLKGKQQLAEQLSEILDFKLEPGESYFENEKPAVIAEKIFERYVKALNETEKLVNNETNNETNNFE